MKNITNSLTHNLISLNDFIINENLKSVSAKIFSNLLKKELGDIIRYTTIESDDENKPGVVFCRFKEGFSTRTMDSKILDKILNLCKKYNYFIADEMTGFTFEPIISEEITKLIKSEYNNKIYHVTTNGKSVKSIKTHGLLTSGPDKQSATDNPLLYMSWEQLANNKKIESDNVRDQIRKFMTYRYFPDRCFVFITKETTPYKICEVTYDFLCDIKGYDYKNDKTDKYSIIEFDLKNHNIAIFKDSLMNKDLKTYRKDKKDEDLDVMACYTNIDIPASLITNIYRMNDFQRGKYDE